MRSEEQVPVPSSVGGRSNPPSDRVDDFYLSLRDIAGPGDWLAMLVTAAAVGYFAWHVEQAISLARGPWAIFGGGL